MGRDVRLEVLGVPQLPDELAEPEQGEGSWEQEAGGRGNEGECSRGEGKKREKGG